MIFKLSYLNSNLALTLGYLNPALNNSVQENKLKQEIKVHVNLRTVKPLPVAGKLGRTLV